MSSLELKIVLVILLFLAGVVNFWIGIKNRNKLVDSHENFYWKIAVFLFAGAVLAGISVVSELRKPLTVLGYSSAEGITINPQAPDIVLSFSSPITTRDLKIHSYPEVDFVVQPGGFFGTPIWATTITIKPKSTLSPGDNYTFYLSDINGPLSHKNGEEMINVKTRGVEIGEIDPPEGSVVAANQTFTIKLTEEISNLHEWSLMSEPMATFNIEKSNNKTLKVIPKESLRQGSGYKLTLVQTPIIVDRATGKEMSQLGPKIMKTFNISTAQAANVKSLAPQGNGVNPDADIVINFQEPMERNSVVNNLSVSPVFPFQTRWEDGDRKLTLINMSLTKDMEYTILLAKGAKTAKGGLLESEVAYHFRTAGPLKIESTSPKTNSANVPLKSSISLVFDQNVSADISSSITITPEVKGKVVVSGNKYELTPEVPLLTDTKYTLTVSAGATGSYGLPISQSQTIIFYTVPQITVIDVPYYHQDTLFTCNISAVRMLLAFRGKSLTEHQLINLIGTSAPKGEGNPYNGYVSNYGTYWTAVSKGVATLRPIRMITSGKLSDIIAEVKKGNPVMTWGQNGWSTPRDISWTSSDGTFIKAINGMHSVVVRGYSGPDNNPTNIYLNDPWRGQYAISTAEFMRRWNYFLMAMVVE